MLCIGKFGEETSWKTTSLRPRTRERHDLEVNFSYENRDWMKLVQNAVRLRVFVLATSILQILP
jgi:hypothetical protein